MEDSYKLLQDVLVRFLLRSCKITRIFQPGFLSAECTMQSSCKVNEIFQAAHFTDSITSEKVLHQDFKRGFFYLELFRVEDT